MSSCEINDSNVVMCISELLEVKEHSYVISFLMEHWRTMNFNTTIRSLLINFRDTINGDQDKQRAYDTFSDDYYHIVKDQQGDHIIWCQKFFMPNEGCECLHQMRLWAKELSKDIIDAYYGCSYRYNK